MTDPYTSIRIRASTLAAIREEIARLELSAQRGWYETPLLEDSKRDRNEPRVSVERFLLSLLAQRRRHRERRRAAGYARSHKRGKGRPRVAPLPG